MPVNIFIPYISIYKYLFIFVYCTVFAQYLIFCLFSTKGRQVRDCSFNIEIKLQLDFCFLPNVDVFLILTDSGMIKMQGGA